MLHKSVSGTYINPPLQPSLIKNKIPWLVVPCAKMYWVYNGSYILSLTFFLPILVRWVCVQVIDFQDQGHERRKQGRHYSYLVGKINCLR